jgi:LacI family transcriptional regulator
MRDISLATGVSVKTVSRALAGEPLVRESTRALVLAEAARLGFHRNDIAAGLRSSQQSMKTIGVLLGDLANPFFPPLLRGIHAIARQRGHLVLTADAEGDPRQEKEAIQSFLAHRVDGIIIAPTGTDYGYLAHEATFGSAIVFVDSAPLGLQADAVLTTNSASTRHGIEHLLGHGHRRIGYIGLPSSGYGVPKRWDGYLAALKQADIAPDPTLVRRGLRDESEAAAAADELLCSADPPTALFTDNNRMTIGVLQSSSYARRPVDLVGFDHFDLAEQLGVSVIDSNPFGVGKAGAELLFRRLADRAQPPLRATVRGRLLVHEPPAGGSLISGAALRPPATS